MPELMKKSAAPVKKIGGACEKSVDSRGRVSYTVSVMKKKLSASHLIGQVTDAG